MRGDIYPDKLPLDDFKYASDLIRFIKEEEPTFQISGACHPEIHPEAINRVKDLQNLKRKVDSGCDDLITQLFLTMKFFIAFVKIVILSVLTYQSMLELCRLSIGIRRYV